MTITSILAFVFGIPILAWVVYRLVTEDEGGPTSPPDDEPDKWWTE